MGDIWSAIYDSTEVLALSYDCVRGGKDPNIFLHLWDFGRKMVF